MNKIKEKAVYFLTALVDVYRDEENRELAALPKMKFADDATEDFTAMILAMYHMCENMTGFKGDLIDFTHMMNKLAVQYIMDGERKDNG